jgi:Rrf2 family transcriptional regulator, nitric oxide-sensitive transcriptional repressor
VRGKKGGFRLAKKPNQIKVGAVVRDLEEALSVVGCMQQTDYCPIEGTCVLRRALGEATAAFLAVLDRYTLDDLVKPRKSLARLLDLGAALPA